MAFTPRRRCRKEREWLKKALGNLKEAGWHVRFDRQREYRGGLFGYCCGNELHVAIGRKGWFPVFVHEYSHFLQAQDGLWIASKDNNALERFDEWLGYRREIAPRKLYDDFRSILGCEADAEVRAIRIMQSEGFGSVDRKGYIKGATVYLWSYMMALKFREWFLPVVRWDRVPEELTLEVPEWFEARYANKVCG